MNGFERYSCFPLLGSNIAKHVVKCAEQRIGKSGIHEFMGSDTCTNIASLQHGQISLGKQLGQGSFSSVFAIQSIRTSDDETGDENAKKLDTKKLVVKVLRSKLNFQPAMLAACGADLCKEGMIMATLSHRNILNAQAWAPAGVSAYVNGRHDAFFLVLDRLDETLGERLIQWKKQAQRINLSLVKRTAKRAVLLKERLGVVLQLSAAVKYMHSKRLLHRDMKPANLGFQEGVLKVFDFDTSCIVPEPTTNHPDQLFQMTRRVGSPRYMAPEVALGDAYNLKADVYTFSLLAHELISLEKPYDDLPTGQHDQLVFVDGVRPYIPPSSPSSWPKAMVSLLETCWSADSARRPDMTTVDRILQKELPLMMIVMVQPPASPKKQSRAMRLLPRGRDKTATVASCA